MDFMRNGFLYISFSRIKFGFVTQRRNVTGFGDALLFCVTNPNWSILRMCLTMNQKDLIISQKQKAKFMPNSNLYNFWSRTNWKELDTPIESVRSGNKNTRTRIWKWFFYLIRHWIWIKTVGVWVSNSLWIKSYDRCSDPAGRQLWDGYHYFGVTSAF